ncbi:hypothetical protein PPSIR1_01557 [Plesiocystis pacifica SIR-1]|uniref:DUF899 domain-containing protein n=1 Tax=Plesiocystis pacifica SIR-1 TaxID=391625 RepID=A6G8G2_9BACT|nr:DUF899 domain-containing protein [Plesiocystis pacifica]EDM77872.1 hypothetical protein PPSIR1_01557 [Plesiocystis pacifica SIR-1]
MTQPRIVTRAEWLEARAALLAEEKRMSKLRDELNAKRRAMPWVRVEADYRFTDAAGEHALAELFEGRSQLIVQHFMFGPDWDEGCPSCSFWADNYDGTVVHLNARDISFVAVSNAPVAKLEAYKARMGWGFRWLSSMGSTFNRDYQVSFTRAELDAGEAIYNYAKKGFPSTEAPGASVFTRDEQGRIFHTYSTYARGLDMLNGAYHYMDLVPKGRDEDELPYSMAWLRRHDSYT